MEPAHPIVVTLAARLEAIDALPGAKRRSPRIMPDETKLALTDCASHGLVRPVTFQAVRHCFLLLACAHFECAKTKRIVSNGSIERRLSSCIQGGGTMIRRLRALGRVLEFAGCDPATAFVRWKPRSQAMPDWLRNHRPDKPKFTGHRRHTGGILLRYQAIRCGASL